MNARDATKDAGAREQAPPWTLSVGEVLGAQGVDALVGLSRREAAERLGRWGPNELPREKGTPAWRRLLAQFQNSLVILLLLATLISVALWWLERSSAAPYEAMAIFAVVLLNAAMGYMQQARAEEAVAALYEMSAAHAKVIRESQRMSVPAATVAPGDLIVIEEGDRIPADGRLVRSTGLHAAEAALTGESLPVEKGLEPVDAGAAVGDRTNMVFSGTDATYGRGLAVVTATGVHTQMGRIAGMLKGRPKEVTPLQRDLDHVGKVLGLVVVVIAVVMIATIILVQDVHGVAAFLQVLIFGVALAVAAVPEGLPAIVTAVLSVGVQRMAKRKAIVRHLSAVETLGSANVVASDKTGTLTRNEMTVRAVVTASGRVSFEGTGYAPQGAVRRFDGGPIDGDLREELRRALAAADRANNAVLQEQQGRWVVHGDPTEGALIVAARKAGLESRELQARLARIGEIPFSSERKLMSTLHTDAHTNDRLLVFTKGAPDVLLARCTQEMAGEGYRALTAQRRAQIRQVNEQLAGEALRTLGVAMRPLPADAFLRDDFDERAEQELVFLGLIGMMDPPRPEAKDAVARAQRAGVRPLMITGDHPKTAAVIAAELGVSHDGGVVTGPELERMSDQELQRTVLSTSVYARVDPHHKLRIVEALQKDGAIVAMTGDGVNDAPALKRADIGVAMGRAGTDVARQAADMVLQDDNFATIVAAIEEGRGIFANIRKFLRYMLATNIGEVLTMFLAVVFADALGLTGAHGVVALPLLATQVLWINMVTDGAPALALGVDPAAAQIMDRPPRPRGERVITAAMWRRIVLVGVVMALAALFVLDASLRGGLIEGPGTLRYAQTMVFTTLVFCSMFAVFSARSDERSAFVGLFANKWLWGAVILSVLLQAAVVYLPFLQRPFSTTPLSGFDWLTCALAASSVLWVSELAKALTRVKSKGKTQWRR